MPLQIEGHVGVVKVLPPEGMSHVALESTLNSRGVFSAVRPRQRGERVAFEVSVRIDKLGMLTTLDVMALLKELKCEEVLN